MKKLILSAIGAFMCVGVATVSAQEQKDEVNIKELFENVRSLSTNLQGTVGSLDQRIVESAEAGARGGVLLDEMLEAAEKLNASLNSDSEIWGDINKLMEGWKGRRDKYAQDATEDPALIEIVDAWQGKIDEGLILRNQILEQSAESQALMDQIRDQRKLVLAYYELDQADKVLETMRQMSSELESMNDSMKEIVDRTGVVTGQETSQE